MGDNVLNTVKTFTAGFSVVFSYLFGGWSQLLIALIVFVSFDFITGILAAGHEGKLNAKVSFWGIPKKVLIFGMVAIAHVVDLVYIDTMGQPLAIGEMKISVMAATILYYLVNEFISISENLGRLGMPVPTPLKKAIEIFKETSNKEER